MSTIQRTFRDSHISWSTCEQQRLIPSDVAAPDTVHILLGYSWSVSYTVPAPLILKTRVLPQGSEKYPGEAEWEEYLSQRGGESNGTTCHEYTEFYFNVPPDGMPGALDRLAAILRAPLFKANSLQREIKAVQAEFEGKFWNSTFLILAC